MHSFVLANPAAALTMAGEDERSIRDRLALVRAND
jgi:hypothetical protein